MADVRTGANTFNDLAPLLKEVYPKPKKRKTESKRFARISRLMETPKKTS